MRTPLLSCALLGLLATVATGQNYRYLPASLNPANVELNRWLDTTFMTAESRSQFFYDATETGPGPFVIRNLALRYDGPIPAVGAPGPFNVTRLRIRVGTTSVARPTADYAANLSQPLTQVFDGPISYLADPGFASPHPFGGQNDQFVFPAATPVGIGVPQGGWFVVEILVEGNGNAGLSHALLDAALAAGGPAAGTATSSGTGCPASPGGPNATILSTGQYGLGQAFSLHGTGLGANAVVLTAIGASDQHAFGGSVALPLSIPGTGCTLYNSLDLVLVQGASAAGSIPARADGSWIVVPVDPALAQARLFAQHLSFAASAPAGFALSDKRTIDLGAWTPPSIGIWSAVTPDNVNATFANTSSPLGLALRIETM